MGPVIHQRARDKFLAAVEEGKKSGKIVAGGNALREGEYANGYFVQPTIIDQLPLEHHLFYEELFLPVLTVGQVNSLEEAIQLSNKA